MIGCGVGCSGGLVNRKTERRANLYNCKPLLLSHFTCNLGFSAEIREQTDPTAKNHIRKAIT